MSKTNRPFWITLVCLSLIPLAGLAQDQSLNPAATSAHQQIKDDIKRTPEWQRAKAAFDYWLSVQQVYTPAEAQQLRRDLQLRISAMSPAELQSFLGQMEGRLGVLLSSEANEARNWVGATMSAMATHKREEFRRSLPSPASMSAAQMQQHLNQFQQQRREKQQIQSATSQFRSQQVQASQQFSLQQQQAFQDARQRSMTAAADQATNRVQQGFDQSLQNSQQFNSMYPARWDGPVAPWGAYFYGAHFW